MADSLLSSKTLSGQESTVRWGEVPLDVMLMCSDTATDFGLFCLRV